MMSCQITTTPAGQKIVRKRIDDDCMLGGELHPSIAERLARVRELPVGAVANLYGIQRDSAGAWLVWQYIDGQTLESLLTHGRDDAAPYELDSILRQLKLAVAAIHSHGIVHGAIHARNVIIDAAGRVHLTHISPLLYSDPDHDNAALSKLLDQAVTSSGQGLSEPLDWQVDRPVRRRAYLAAGIAMLASVLLFAAILWYIHD